MTTTEIITRIAKLKAMAEGAAKIGSEEEAQAFAAMMQSLLLKHNLEMSDVEFAELDKTDEVRKHRIDYSKYPGFKLTNKRTDWSENLAGIIATAHFCQILVHSGSNRISFVGRKSDCEVAEYMYVYLHRAISQLAYDAYDKFSRACVNTCCYCKLDKKQHGSDGRLHGHIFQADWSRTKGYKASYMRAFMARLAERYYNERRSKQESFGLMRMNQMEKKVKDFLAEKDDKGKLKIKAAAEINGQSNTWNRSGLAHGREAADRINLGGGLPEGQRTAATKKLS